MFYSILLRHLPSCTTDQGPQNLTESGRSYSSSTSEEIRLHLHHLHQYIDHFLPLLLLNTRGRCWRLVPHLRVDVHYRVVLSGPSTCWSALTSRLGLYYSFFPFTCPHMAIFHQRTPTVPRRLSPGEFSSSTTPCAKSSPPLWILSPSGQT